MQLIRAALWMLIMLNVQARAYVPTLIPAFVIWAWGETTVRKKSPPLRPLSTPTSLKKSQHQHQMPVRPTPILIYVSGVFTNVLPYFDISDDNSTNNGSNPFGPKKDKEEMRYGTKNEQNTVGLVVILMVGVTSIFMAFAGAALCYRFFFQLEWWAWHARPPDKATPNVMFLLLLHRFARRTQLSSCQNSCSSMYLSRNMFKDTMTAIPLPFFKKARRIKVDWLFIHIFVTFGKEK